MNYLASKYEIAKQGKSLDIIRLFMLEIVLAAAVAYVLVKLFY